MQKDLGNIFKAQLLLQGLFVVFLWSASKIAIKYGLTEISPYSLMAIVQIVAALSIWISVMYQAQHKKPNLSKTDITVAIMNGVVTFAGANLFVTIGLQYVTGAMAGLVASTTSVFGFILAAMLLREKPKAVQFLGMAIVILGAYIFLAKDVLSGHLIGIGLLLVAEMAFAYGNVSNRLIALNHAKDVSPVVNLIGNVIGAAVLVPMVLLQGDWERVLTLPGWMWGLLVVLGLVYAYSGVLWGKLLDKLRVVEVSVLANTMIIQVAVLSVIFLGESISAHNVLGGAVVIVGALLVDGALFYKKLRT